MIIYNSRQLDYMSQKASESLASNFLFSKCGTFFLEIHRGENTMIIHYPATINLYQT